MIQRWARVLLLAGVVGSFVLSQFANRIDPYGHVRGIFGLRFIKAVEPPVVTVYRLPSALLARDGWAALASATAYAGDHTE